jgi:uncharacterized repeat protein (TIGR03803 family)
MIKLSCYKTICVFCVLHFATVISAPAQTFTTLVYFNDGSSVFSSLIQGRDGSLYGTSNNGGVSGAGSVFKVTPSGTLTTLYSFCSQANCADGSLPFSALSLGVDGNFYGTTQNGGTVGLGTAFKITPGGGFTVLHSFDGTDGSSPDAGLVLGSDGNFYGTTYGGGNSEAGTVFKITPAGALTTLHSFAGTDGDFPVAAVVQGFDGNFYGTTYAGGDQSSPCFGACGTVFKVTPRGKFTSLHSFDFTDGSTPYAPLVQAGSGAFYGTTFGGGDVDFHGCAVGCGTIFKISSGGAFATVHKFHGGGDGGNLDSALIQATDGNLYGENLNAADIFEFTLPRTFTTEHSFSAAGGGGGSTEVFQATDGEFYGTYGGTDGVPGAVFSLDTGLAPFVAFVIPTGTAGKTAQILGQGLVGTTSVTFNGFEATSFAVVSDTYMTAVVPSGATTGSVVVTTPTGTLTSGLSQSNHY